MKRIFIISVLMAYTSICLAQWVVDTLKDVPNVNKQEVTFLSAIPNIDGVLDKQLESLPIRKFAVISRDKKDAPVQITYRIAYGTEFFYVYIEVQAEHFIFQDRSFQNGDGFLLLLGKPQPNNAQTDEFYELACSEVNKPERIWQRCIFWNYNVDKVFRVTSRNTRLKTHEGNGKICYELLLPWTDVRPYHPWISENIAFNLSFCKAIEPKGVAYYQVEDDNYGNELKKRSYTTLRFQNPVVEGNSQTFVSLKEGHINTGQTINAVAATVSNKSTTEHLTLFFGTPETITGGKPQSYPCQPGITKHEFSIDGIPPMEGAYTFSWNSQNEESIGNYGISVLPEFNEDEINQILDKNKSHLSKGSFNTFQFLIHDIKMKIENLKIYETCINDRFRISNFMKMLNSVDRGIDPFLLKPGFISKGYQSKVDNSFQPYMVYLPENYDKTKKYPLMIFLHGSASDETTIQRSKQLIPKNYIAVAPFGREKSGGFTNEHAQDDITEVITAVCEDYPIDTTKILLTGFSMGGYGVYRTFFETPNRYKALAVFSGNPRWRAKNAPDFTDEKHLNSFNKVPIFIFHGEKDMNIPISTTKEVAAKLKKVGAQVEFQIDPDKGHEMMADSTVEIYMKWVERVMK